MKQVNLKERQRYNEWKSGQAAGKRNTEMEEKNQKAGIAVSKKDVQAGEGYAKTGCEDAEVEGKTVETHQPEDRESGIISGDLDHCGFFGA